MTDWLSRMFVRDYGRVNDPGVRVSYGIMAGVVGIVLNVALCVAKAAVGVAAGSVSIVADAVNNLSDASSNIVTLTGFKLASKPADSGHPYGHGRFEYLAGLVVAVLVTAVGFEIIRGGISRIIDPEPVEVSLPLLIVMLLSIAAKAWMMSFNKKLGDRIESETLAATAVDSRNDVITTTAVLVCALVSRFTGLELDGWAGLAVGIFVLVSGLALVRDTVNPLLGEAPSQEMVDRVVALVLATPGILGVHDLMIHDYGPGRKVASAHAEMDSRTSLLTAHTTLDGIERRVAFETGITLTLHCDPIDVSQVRKRPKAGGTPAGLRK
ncbi:cation diffusion facilitator family transporter [Parolsenella sp. LCP21S3_E11]|uniref:cation diffusion facilitator family transporter n=1 Tax=Parolsenella sp. LCP21S3_E11 TaxID=3438797 RepID=UPI003F9D1322